jgi:hypothetical protein
VTRRIPSSDAAIERAGRRATWVMLRFEMRHGGRSLATTRQGQNEDLQGQARVHVLAELLSRNPQ